MGVAAFALLVFMGVVLWLHYDSSQKCRERGGVPLQGVYWVECVDMERK